MKSYLNSLTLRSGVASLLLALSVISSPSMAHAYTVGDIEVDHPYAPPTPPGVAMAAGYMLITNHGDQDDRLIGGKVYFAHELQIHQTVVVDDVSRMRRLEEGLLIPAGATVKVEPMGIHIMFVDLAEPLVEGDRQPVTLYFEKAGELDVEFAIEHPGSGAMDNMHGEHMKMDKTEMKEMEVDAMKMDEMKMDETKMPGTHD